jgi:hypothetical protein
MQWPCRAVQQQPTHYQYVSTHCTPMDAMKEINDHHDEL